MNTQTAPAVADPADELERAQNLPVSAEDLRNAGFPAGLKMATGLAIFFNEPLYQRCKAIALRMAGANGIVGPHLIGKPNACFAVVSRSITWNLDPFAVAQATYEVQGKIGYEGKLVQAILENCGALEGRVGYEFHGDWAKLRGKFKMVSSARNSDKKTPEATYTTEDEEGLSVTVRAQIKGEATPREEEFFLREMWPRNSTLWATRPRQQMMYASVRAFASVACPGLLMGIPFDVDPSGFYSGTGGDQGMQDITPQRPARPADNPFNRQGGDQQTSPPVDQEQGHDQDEKEKVDAVEETPFQRGARLLAAVTTIADLSDLRASIAEELGADNDALAKWDEACDARGKALTPKTSPKARTAGK